jgi:membrane protein YdbS with pleckstrin-like domain
MDNETLIWKGSPSQITNAITFFVLLSLSFLVVTIPLTALLALWFYLVVKCLRYELTTQRLKIHSGVFSKRLEELELYRVTDTTYFQPWYLRPFGLANITLITTDKSTVNIEIYAIQDAIELREKIRVLVEKRRAEKHIREIEVN